MEQEVVLAMLAKQPSQGYQLRARLNRALGPLGEEMNDGQIYVTLGSLEKAGFVARLRAPDTSNPAERMVYELTAAGQEGAHGWRSESSWPSLGPRPGGPDRTDRKVYELTPAGNERLNEWLAEVSWPKPDLAEFHLKLVAAAVAGLADPVGIVEAQRRELLRRLRDAQRAAMAESDHSAAGLLLEGIVLRLQADLRWLEVCERAWNRRRRNR